MALIRCNECGGKVSDSAKTCPHCGKEVNVDDCMMDGAIKNIERDRKKKILIVVIVIFVIILSWILMERMIDDAKARRGRETAEMLREWDETHADEVQ